MYGGVGKQQLARYYCHIGVKFCPVTNYPYLLYAHGTAVDTVVCLKISFLWLRTFIDKRGKRTRDFNVEVLITLIAPEKTHSSIASGCVPGVEGASIQGRARRHNSLCSCKKYRHD